MKFLLTFFRIFFRNKWNEIKHHFRFTCSWSDLWEILISLFIGIILVSVLFGIAAGLGYILIGVFHLEFLINSEQSMLINYAGAGFATLVVIVGIMFIIYQIGNFIRWIFSNIKMAIAETKEIIHEKGTT